MHMVLPKGRQTDDLPSVPSNKHLNCVRYVTTKIKLTKKRTQDNNDIKQKKHTFFSFRHNLYALNGTNGRVWCHENLLMFLDRFC